MTTLKRIIAEMKGRDLASIAGEHWPEQLAALAVPGTEPCEVCGDTGGVQAHMNGRDNWHPCPRGCTASRTAADPIARRSDVNTVYDRGLVMVEVLRAHGHADELNALAEDRKRLKHSEREAVSAAQDVCMRAAALIRELLAEIEMAGADSAPEAVKVPDDLAYQVGQKNGVSSVVVQRIVADVLRLNAGRSKP